MVTVETQTEMLQEKEMKKMKSVAISTIQSIKWTQQTANADKLLVYS